MIRLIASDIDGTLLKQFGGAIDEKMFSTIRALKKRGIIFMAASGRQYANLQSLFEPVKDDISYLCENGSLLVHEGQILFKGKIDQATGQQMIDTILKRDSCEALVSGIHTCYIQPKAEAYARHVEEVLGNKTTRVTDLTGLDTDILKIAAYDPDSDKTEALLKYFQERFGNIVTVATSGNGWVDMAPKNVNKGTTMEIFLEKTGIRPDQVMAFGDQQNDLEMLRLAGISYAMKDGRAEVKEAAGAVTDSVVATLGKFIEING